MQHSCSHSNAICNHSFIKRIELRTQERPLVAEHEEEPIASGTTAAATAAQTRYLSSPAATTLHGKTQGFVLRLPPQNFAHATFTQPFQSDLRPQLQERHRTTHTGTTTRCRTQRRNQSRPERPQPQPPHRRGTFHRRLQPLYTEKHKITQGFVLRLPPQNFAHATFMQIMQPFQCDLHPQIQETHKTTHAGTTTRCRTQRRNQSRPERPQPQPPHRRGTFHRRLQPLHGKTQGFVPRLPPKNKAHATFMQPFQCDLEPQLQETHRTTHTGTTIRNRVRNDRSRNRRTDEVPFIAGCNHFTRKNTRFRAPASSPKLCPCNIHAAIPIRSATTASRKA